ncbi:hypothetical protein ACFL3G_12420 [Planctomycetota bacterium]
MKADNNLLKKVADLYNWIDSQPPKNNQCAACGKCCNFDAYDHRLYITPPELIYFRANVPNQKPMHTGKCPYNIEDKCSVYKYRFAGCRIFCCKTDPDAQSQLTETTLKKLKEICIEEKIPYKYIQLPNALIGPI